VKFPAAETAGRLKSLQWEKFELFDILFPSLVPDVSLDHPLVAPSADRRNVVAVCPEFAAPEFGHDLENPLGRNAFYHLDHLASGMFGQEPAEDVDMVLVESGFADLHRIPLLESNQWILDRLSHLIAQQGFPILDRYLNVIETFREVVIPVPDFVIQIHHDDIISPWCRHRPPRWWNAAETARSSEILNGF